MAAMPAVVVVMTVAVAARPAAARCSPQEMMERARSVVLVPRRSPRAIVERARWVVSAPLPAAVAES